MPIPKDLMYGWVSKKALNTKNRVTPLRPAVINDLRKDGKNHRL
ncbi:MAG: hypothetical protein PF482_12175 [Desulfobacteraceae bacterium]|nr:hypothetical protein [Desulfobacteraceae bacterium]